MRSFIAIELPKEIRDSLSSIQEKLKTCGADVKWVQPQNIHLTLKFLGEINEEQLSKINLILDALVKDKKSFSIRLASLGAFPKINYPRVIWVGIDRGDKETQELAKALEEKIQKIGIPKEDRPFSSHITIGRIRSNLRKDKLVTSLKNLENYFKETPQEFTVNKTTLFKSTLTPKGPIYEVVKEVNLATI
jgi:2'-5' RNA ligase